MTKSAMIKEKIMQLLSDGSPHSVSEMKDYLVEKEMEDYSEGQFAGSVDNLLKNKKIEKVDRGTYRIVGAEMILTKERNGVFMKKCFVCQKEVEDNDIYCTYCGTKLVKEKKEETKIEKEIPLRVLGKNVIIDWKKMYWKSKEK